MPLSYTPNYSRWLFNMPPTLTAPASGGQLSAFEPLRAVRAAVSDLMAQNYLLNRSVIG